MSRGIAFLTVIGLFLVGLASGVLGAHVYTRRMMPTSHLPEHHETIRRERLMTKVREHLDLSDEQMRQIREILDESHRRGQALRESVRPQVALLMDETREEILELLEPEQKERLESMRRNQRRIFEHMMLGDPGQSRRMRDRRPPRR